MSKSGIIYTIVGSLLMVFLIVALVLNFAGIHHVDFDNSYYKLMQTASIRSSSWNIEIPQIPNIPYGDSVGVGWDILHVLTDIGNFLVNFLNVFVTIINFVLNLFTFIVAVISLIKDIPTIISA